jgi:hypothetical protein
MEFQFPKTKYVCVGLATLIAVYILKIPDLGTEDVASVLDWVFSIIFPTYCLGSGIMNVYIILPDPVFSVPNCGRFLHFTYYVCHTLPNIESLIKTNTPLFLQNVWQD